MSLSDVSLRFATESGVDSRGEWPQGFGKRGGEPDGLADDSRELLEEG